MIELYECVAYTKVDTNEKPPIDMKHISFTRLYPNPVSPSQGPYKTAPPCTDPRAVRALLSPRQRRAQRSTRLPNCISLLRLRVPHAPSINHHSTPHFVIILSLPRHRIAIASHRNTQIQPTFFIPPFSCYPYSVQYTQQLRCTILQFRNCFALLSNSDRLI